MNWSAGLVAEVPSAVATVMSAVPEPGGLVAVISVPETMVKSAAVPPKLTPVAPVKPVPVIVTLVPPALVPPAGETPVTETCCAGPMVPVPLRATSIEGMGAVKWMRRSAVRDPGADGVKITVIVQVCARGTRRLHAGSCVAARTALPPR